MDILVIGDAHAKPSESNERFTWLGRMVLDLQPEVIIDMGDWEDMPSLCSYDMGKISYEGRRYSLDIASAVEARALFNAPIEEHNRNQKLLHKKQYTPKKWALGGNHFERRIERVIASTPLLRGTIHIEDGQQEKFGWEYVPFLEPITVGGITFNHFFQGNGTSNPIGMGKYPAQTLLRERHSSCVMGHNHLFDVASDVNAREERIWAFSAGCYFEHWEDYAVRNNRRWQRGILLLKDVKYGDIGGFEWVSLDNIKEKYGY